MESVKDPYFRNSHYDVFRSMFRALSVSSSLHTNLDQNFAMESY